MIGTLEAKNKVKEEKNIFEENSQEPFKHWWKTLSHKLKKFNDLQIGKIEKTIPRCKMFRQGKAKDKDANYKNIS